MIIAGIFSAVSNFAQLAGIHSAGFSSSLSSSEIQSMGCCSGQYNGRMAHYNPSKRKKEFPVLEIQARSMQELAFGTTTTSAGHGVRRCCRRGMGAGCAGGGT